MVTTANRTFEDKPAARDRVPVLIGLVGPSSSGKTKSALRLAQGMQSVVGGDIYGIDTESKRMLHYASEHQFRHLEFNAPFGSLDYLNALQHCVKKGAKVVIVDSLSHEHEGPGGLIDFQEQEVERLAGNDFAKRERVKMLAWQKPKAARRALINGMLQLNANFIFCFRAREKTKPIKVGNKTEIVEMGFMPIAGEEFLFEMTANCLLLPKSGGVPTWKSEHLGELSVMKMPSYLANIFEDGKALDERTGVRLAEWAAGPKATTPPTPAAATSPVGADQPTKNPRELVDAYATYVADFLEAATTPKAVADWWNSEAQKTQRKGLHLLKHEYDDLKVAVTGRINALKMPVGTL